jgi:hypothetical protein
MSGPDAILILSLAAIFGAGIVVGWNLCVWRNRRRAQRRRAAWGRLNRNSPDVRASLWDGVIHSPHDCHTDIGEWRRAWANAARK